MIASCALAHSAIAAPVFNFDIPPQTIERALIAVVVQANGSLGGDFKACVGQSQGFHGQATLSKALKKVLASSGCRFRITGDDAILILAPPSPEHPVEKRVQSHARSESESTVVVTAPRTSDTFLSGAGARTVVDSEQMRLAGVNTLAEAVPLIPGVVATNLGPGRDKIVIRGLSDGVFPGEAISPVAVVLDDSPLNYTEKDPSLRLVDIADVTVARGPQGLIPSAIGGIIRVRTNEPVMDSLSGVIEATAQSVRYGKPGGAIDLIANAPLPALNGAVRAVLYDDTEPGYIRDILPTGVSTNTSHETGGRISLQNFLGGHWSLTSGVVWQRLSVADSQYVFNTTSDFSRTNRIAEPSSNDANYVYSTLSGALGQTRIRWTESYSDHELSDRYDATQSLAVFGLSEATAAAYDSRQHVQTLVSDLSVALPLLGGHWRVGGLMVNERDTANAILGLVTLPNAPLYQDARNDYREDLSAFVEATYDLAANLDLELGATAYRLDQDIKANAVNAAGAIVGKPFTTEVAQDGLKPSVALIYTPTDTLTLSARFVEGARPPGVNTGVLLARRGTGVSPFQANRTYEGDRVNDFELNQKYTGHSSAITLALSEFVVQWRDVQADEFSIYNTPITVNIGDGVLYGAEAELIYKSTVGTEIHTLGGVEQTSLGGKVTKAYFSGSYGGLIGVPKYNAGLSIDQPFNLAPLKILTSLQFRALGPSRATFDGVTASSLRGYQVVDASTEFQLRSWALLIIVNNALDSTGDTLAFGNPFSVQRGREITPVRPRMVSAKLKYSF